MHFSFLVISGQKRIFYGNLGSRDFLLDFLVGFSASVRKCSTSLPGGNLVDGLPPAQSFNEKWGVAS